MDLHQGSLNSSGYVHRSDASSMADDEDRKEIMGGGNNSKRQRVHFSCTECHRRKQKCNRETPCQHCLARKIPERCKTFQPGEEPGDLGSRVTRLERMMHENFDRMFDMLQQQQQPRPVKQTAFKRAQIQSNEAAALQAQADATGSEAGDEVLEDEQSPNAHQFNPSKPMSMKIDSIMDTFSSGQGTTALNDRVRSIEGATDLDALMYEYGATESISQPLVAIFPPREKADALIDHFFVEINWLRQPLNQRMFRERYEMFWKSGPTLTANNINDYAILIIAMAIALCSIEKPNMFPEDPRTVRLTARRLFFAGRRALLVSTMLSREDIQQVVGYSLASRFLILDRRITEAWTCVANAVKTAHSIGLHRDGLKLHLSNEESETRRRLWSSIYFTDRNLCMNLGRPTQIDDNVVDTQEPSEGDDHDAFPDMFKPLSVPSKQAERGESILPPPSPLSYTRHRHRLAVIMGKIISTYQNLHTPAHYSDIISIDKELELYRTSLPSYFRSEIDGTGELYHVDQTWDEEYPFVTVHRYLLESEIDHIRVSLHRPYLLRTNHKSSHRYEYSRRACISAAHHNILVRKDVIKVVKERCGKDKIPKVLRLHLGTYKTLNSLIIIGMYLLVTPEAEDAELLLDHLRFYVDQWGHQSQGKGYAKDEMKDREVSIVKLFLQRIEETRAEAQGKKEAAKAKGEEEGGRAGGRNRRGAGQKRKKTSMSSMSDYGGVQASGGKATDEDTAGLLLDLNQSGGKAAAMESYEELSGSKRGRVQPSREVVGASSATPGAPPWPYLPMNTHHNNAPGQQPGLSSINNGTSPASASVSQSREDSGGMGAGTGSSGGASTSASNGATAAQQLFESWFRYNAFDTMDFDTFNTDNTPPHQQPPHLSGDQVPSFSPQGFGANLSAAEKNGAEGAVAAKLPESPSNLQINSSGVSLSTLPAPIWTSPAVTSGASGNKVARDQNSLGSAGLSTQFASSGPDAGAGGGGGGYPLSLLGNTGMGANGTSNSDHLSDASFDPIFWQGLIDKIAS